MTTRSATAYGRGSLRVLLLCFFLPIEIGPEIGTLDLARLTHELRSGAWSHPYCPEKGRGRAKRQHPDEVDGAGVPRIAVTIGGPRGHAGRMWPRALHGGR
jgi:hypothetical protein